MVFTNIPWTQVVLAGCASTMAIIALITIMWKMATFISDLRKDVNLVLFNHLPHIFEQLKKLVERNKRVDGD